MHPTLDDLKKTSRVKRNVRSIQLFRIPCFHDIMLIRNRVLYSSLPQNNRMPHLPSARILEEVWINPKERVNQITIPGRDGVLILPENTLPVYEHVLKTVTCWVRPDADINALCAWLQGSGSVVFGNEPERSYDARIINQIDFSKILRGREYRSFAVPFQCQPYKRLYPPAEDIILTASGMTIHNPGTVPAWPKFTIYGSGTITLITYSGAVVLSGIGNGIVLDWEAQECTSLDGGSLLNDKVDGDPQYLPPGDSTITWKGTVARLVVTPSWRYL